MNPSLHSETNRSASKLETEPTESAAEQSLDLLRRERANFVNSPQLCRVITTQPDPSSL